MKNLLTEVAIKNFKSIKEIEFQTSRVNLFIGKPNSGKSNILEALAMTQFVSDKSYPDLFNNPLLRCNEVSGLFFDNNIDGPIQIKTNKSHFWLIAGTDRFDGQAYSSQYDLIQVRDESDADLNKILKSVRTLEFFVESDGVIKITKQGDDFSCDVVKYSFDGNNQFLNPSKSVVLDPIGSNLFEVVMHNSYLKNWAADFMSESALEFVLDIRTKKFFIQKRKENLVYTVDFDSTPDTFRRMLFTLAAIKSNKDKVLLFEEPESHSFPPYINQLAEVILEDVENQYFITSHSPYMINRFITNVVNHPEELSILYTYFIDGETKVKRLTETEIETFYSSGADILLNLDWIDI